jgi:hypothetical protein
MVYTREPWKVSGTNNIVAGGNYVVALDCRPGDAHRIVACVNACVDIPTYILDRGLSVSKLSSDYNELATRCDELLAALEKVNYSMVQALKPGNDRLREIQLSRALSDEAIARAKGQS